MKSALALPDLPGAYLLLVTHLGKGELRRERNDFQHRMRRVRWHAKVMSLLPRTNAGICGVVEGVLLGKPETLPLDPVVLFCGKTVAVFRERVMGRGVQSFISHGACGLRGV